MSFKQTDRTSEALSVKKTRQNTARSASNLARGTTNLGALSPPREESGNENQEMTTSRRTTPLKSSLKSPTKNATDNPKAGEPTDHEKVSPKKKGEDPTMQSLYVSRVPTNPRESKAQDNGPTPSKHVAKSMTDSKPTHEAKVDTPRFRDFIRSTPRAPKPTDQDGLDVAPGKNLKPTFSCDLDSMTAYAVVPGAKILSGTSTMRYQPKTSHTDSGAELRNVGSSSRSLKSTHEKDDIQAEKSAPGSAHIVTTDQMDGAADIVLTGNLCRGSFRDLKNQFEGRQTAFYRPSSYPIWKRSSHARLPQHSDVPIPDQKLLFTTPRKASPISATSSRFDLKRGAGKVMDLAAKFDSAAKISPFIPTVESAEHKHRRDAAGLVSPYTSNASPIQSVTPASTPASLMRQSRDTMHLPSTAVESARKSRIPRPQHVESGGKGDHSGPAATARTESGYSLGTVRSHPAKSSLPIDTSPSRSLGRGRNASSLRDQIRSLRQELSSKNEECAQLRLEFEENRKASQVSGILLREDLDHAKAELAKWKRRAERAESKAERLERMATRAQEIRAQSGGRSHDFSFVSGLPDDIDVGERPLQVQPLSARMNQSARRAPENTRPTETSVMMGNDAMSDCSGSTVVRNTYGAEDGHWASVGEMIESAAPALMDDLL